MVYEYFLKFGGDSYSLFAESEEQAKQFYKDHLKRVKKIRASIKKIEITDIQKAPFYYDDRSEPPKPTPKAKRGLINMERIYKHVPAWAVQITLCILSVSALSSSVQVTM